MQTQAWHWLDTDGDVTSKCTLVRFGRGEMSGTPFLSGEALIEEPVHQRYETLGGPVIDAPTVPRSVRLTIHGVAESDAMLDGAARSIAAEGIAVPELFVLIAAPMGDMWTLTAVAGEVALSVTPALGPPPLAQEPRPRHPHEGNITVTEGGQSVTLWLGDDVRVTRPVRDGETPKEASDRLVESVADYVTEALDK